jgi:hypothetical protein
MATAIADVRQSTGADKGLTLLVAFPASACTSSENAVFLDEEGRFIGAVAPGTAAAMAVGPASKHVFVVGSLDVIAPPGTWFLRREVPRRSDQGVIVAVGDGDEHNCKTKWSGPLSPRPEAYGLAVTAQATRGLRQLQVNVAEGRRWLDDNRERVDELVGRGRPDVAIPQPVVTQTFEAN